MDEWEHPLALRGFEGQEARHEREKQHVHYYPQMLQSQATLSDLSLSLEIEASPTELMLQSPTVKTCQLY